MLLPALIIMAPLLAWHSALANDTPKDCDTEANALMNRVTENLEKLATECDNYVSKRNETRDGHSCAEVDCSKISDEIGSHKDRIRKRNLFCERINKEKTTSCAVDKGDYDTIIDCEKGVKQAIDTLVGNLREVKAAQEKSNAAIKALIDKLNSNRSCLAGHKKKEKSRCPTDATCATEVPDDTPNITAALDALPVVLQHAKPVHSDGARLFAGDVNGLGAVTGTRENLNDHTRRMESASPDSAPLNRTSPTNTSTITGQPAAAQASPPAATPASPASGTPSGSASPSKDNAGEKAILPNGPSAVLERKIELEKTIDNRSITLSNEQADPGFAPARLAPLAEPRGFPKGTSAPAKKAQEEEAVAGFKAGIPLKGKFVIAGSEERKVKGMLNELIGGVPSSANSGANKDQADGQPKGGNAAPGADTKAAGGLKNEIKGEGKKAESAGENAEGKKQDKKDKSDPDEILASAKEALAAIKMKYSSPSEEAATTAAEDTAEASADSANFSAATNERIMRDMSLFERVRLAHLRCHTIACVYYGGF